MKKFFFLAVLASVALTSCVKNEPAKVDSQKEITFTTPVLAVPTKTQEIPGTDYLSSSPSFGVYGWYVAGATYVADDATAYMHNVEVKHTNSIKDPADAGDEGAWISDDAYYWPKQGSITFDAYSPYSIHTSVTGDKTNGLTITGFGVTNVLDDQVDLLYSTRAYDKTSSKGTTNGRYDGVDIVFNHALSVVKFTARTAADYSPTTTIKVTKIQIVDALTNATFKQNVDNSARTDNPEWTGHTTNATFTSLDTSEGSATALSTTAEDRGVSMIVLPQDFTASTKLYVEYYIKAGSSTPIKQTFEIALNDSGFSYTEAGSTVTVTGWKIGKRYTYNLVIGLDKIYFAPSVTDWTDVNVTVPTI